VLGLIFEVHRRVSDDVAEVLGVDAGGGLAIADALRLEEGDVRGSVAGRAAWHEALGEGLAAAHALDYELGVLARHGRVPYSS
jgi:hypothetical protein